MLDFATTQRLYKLYNNGQYEDADKARRDFAAAELKQMNFFERKFVQIFDDHYRFDFVRTICQFTANWIFWLLPETMAAGLSALRYRYLQILHFDFTSEGNTKALIYSLFGSEEAFGKVPVAYIHFRDMFPILNMRTMFKDLPPLLVRGPRDNPFILLKQPGVDVPFILNAGEYGSNGWGVSWREQADTSGADQYWVQIVHEGRMKRMRDGKFVFDFIAEQIKKHEAKDTDVAVKKLYEIFKVEKEAKSVATENFVKEVLQEFAEDPEITEENILTKIKSAFALVWTNRLNAMANHFTKTNA